MTEEDKKKVCPHSCHLPLSDPIQKLCKSCGYRCTGEYQNSRSAIMTTKMTKVLNNPGIPMMPVFSEKLGGRVQKGHVIAIEGVI